MDILSTLKTEYSRTLILIVIPGAIALEPYGIILYHYFDLKVADFKDYFIYVAIGYLFASVFIGFVLQDLGARLEVLIDWLYCRGMDKEHRKFNGIFKKYLFNKKEEDYIITHYYRSLLVRLKFELHTIVAIAFLWIGMAIRVYIADNFIIDMKRTMIFVILSFLVFAYLLFEAFFGVKALHYHRVRINRKFRPSFYFESDRSAKEKSSDGSGSGVTDPGS